MEPYEAREIAAKAWCDNSTSHLDMIPELAEAFAKILVEEVGRASPASAPEGFVLVSVEILDRFQELNSSNYDHDDVCALNAWAVELVLAAAPTTPENKALLEAVAEVVWYDPQLSHFPEKPGKIIDGSIAFMESAEIGTKLFAAPVSSVSEGRKDAEKVSK